LRQLEKEVQYLSETMQSLQEETRFIRQLLEKPKSPQALPSGEDQ
jgi:prefoldin subunit 5